MERDERAGTLPDDALQTPRPERPGEGGPAIHGGDLADDAAATPGTPPDQQVAGPSGDGPARAERGAAGTGT
ncbi:MAG TPA: hypothetical protein VFT50_14135 [Baekduia sp.]|nr:hypothetical protein [Baekduia sp.]